MLPLVREVRNKWEKNWPEVHALPTGGLPRFTYARRPGDLGSSVPVFCYHTIDAERFEGDLEFLVANGYRTIGADALLDHLEERCPAPERAVVLSFDDSARNLYEVVYPLLRRYRMNAVAFVAPRFHEGAVTGGGEGGLWGGTKSGKCRTPG
ncbi:MAG: polysaccharide deacetylase family protein [Deferrisomatales bacterium]|nr:polysaccharide deacetylase family protein [Deferrisomatales bacterium]